MMKILPEQHGNVTFTDFLIFISLISYKFGCPPILVLLNYRFIFTHFQLHKKEDWMILLIFSMFPPRSKEE